MVSHVKLLVLVVVHGPVMVLAKAIAVNPIRILVYYRCYFSSYVFNQDYINIAVL